jgi:AbrB family looped-hinge helix DNA binding protein
MIHDERRRGMSTSHVMAKGQVVIPAKLRRKYGIEKGTPVEFRDEEGHIVLQPITPEFIASFRGILKVRPGEKPATQQLLEDRARDREREEVRSGSRRPR